MDSASDMRTYLLPSGEEFDKYLSERKMFRTNVVEYNETHFCTKHFAASLKVFETNKRHLYVVLFRNSINFSGLILIICYM
jgi:hypothetical protein